MTKERIDYMDGYLKMTTKRGIEKIDPHSIKSIDVCRMADILHGDEEFFILHLALDFWLIGPFVKGSCWAISDMQAQHPRIPERQIFFTSLAWKFRESFFLGLRLFPTAGFGKFPASDFSSMKFLIGSPDE